MKQKELLLISVTIFLTIIAWVVLEVKSIRDETPTDQEIQTTKFEYTVNTDLLDILEQRTP